MRPFPLLVLIAACATSSTALAQVRDPWTGIARDERGNSVQVAQPIARARAVIPAAPRPLVEADEEDDQLSNFVPERRPPGLFDGLFGRHEARRPVDVSRDPAWTRQPWDEPERSGLAPLTLARGEDPTIRSDVPATGLDPRFRRQVVQYQTNEKPGTVVIDTNERFLYLVQPGGLAIRYGIGVGRPGFEWKGVKQVSEKREWPDWIPPADMLRRRPDLPTYMAGGPDNPLGARALYLGSSLYRIHGSNEPETIGQAVSSGCFRMHNQDVIDLYERVRIGTRVVVI